MIDKLSKWTIEFVGDQYKKILWYIAVYLLSIAGTQTLKDTLQMPVPLWSVILIVLSILFCCAILSLIHSYRLSNKPNYKIEYFPIDNLKWETKIYNHGHSVEKISICLEHNLHLIHENINYYCPELLKKNCKIIIDHNDYSMFYTTAKSYIDREIRNKNC